MRAISAFSSIAPPPQTAAILQRTSWHSPVPYLFGGLAAMLGLIAFALLILACSYWKLAIQSEESEQRDLESGSNEQNDEKIKDHHHQQQTNVHEENILVIMAGNQKPTFLATPVTPKLPSVNSHENFGKVTEMDRHENDEQEDEAN